MTSTYIALATTTLSNASSSVTFSSIPATYRDLVLVVVGNNSSQDLNIRLNTDSGANYSRIIAYGGPPISFSQSNRTSMESSIGSSNSRGQILQFMDYSATDKHKTVLARNANDELVIMGAFRWANTAAVISLACLAGSGAGFTSGSTFSLYGIN